MDKEDYQGNWRGARRYQFDEETRRKRDAMESREGVIKFRRVKWADPEQKLKVLVEDLQQPERGAEPMSSTTWIERLSTRQFCLLAFASALIAFWSVAWFVSH